jgi:hypothetical protein
LAGAHGRTKRFKRGVLSAGGSPSLLRFGRAIFPIKAVMLLLLSNTYTILFYLKQQKFD